MDTALNLYHLERSKNDYLDRMNGIVVATLTEKDARQIAGEGEPDPGAGSDWLDTEKTSCRLVGVASPDVQVGYVLRDVAWS